MAFVDFKIVNAANVFSQSVSIWWDFRAMRTLKNLISLIMRCDVTIQSSDIFIRTTAYSASDSWLLDLTVIFQVHKQTVLRIVYLGANVTHLAVMSFVDASDMYP